MQATKSLVSVGIVFSPGCSFLGSKSNSSLFIHLLASSRIFFLIYVNDILMTGSDFREISQLLPHKRNEGKNQ